MGIGSVWTSYWIGLCEGVVRQDAAGEGVEIRLVVV